MVSKTVAVCKGDDFMRAEESMYLLEYEKQKLLDCAKSFKELAVVFSSGTEEIRLNLPKEERSLILMQKKLKENRELFADNLREIASIIGNLAGKEISVFHFHQHKIKKIGKLLEEEGLILKDIYSLEGDGNKELLAVVIKRKKKREVTTEELAGYLSVLLDRRLQVVNGMPFFLTEEFSTVYFEEEAKLLALSGYATAIKEMEKVSGDNYSFFEADGNNYITILSDGMGSGEKACADSESVVTMAEKFLEAGFSVETAVQMINDILLLSEEQENMSTLDLCSVDLMTGNAEIAKIGSANSYIKNLREVEQIKSESLPLGIFHNREIQLLKRKIQPGDYIVMLSDGVVDCLEKEKGGDFIQTLIGDLQCERPGEMANSIMKYAINMSKGRIMDDMTVLVVGFWENRMAD